MKIFVIDDDVVARIALIDVIRTIAGSIYQVVEFESGDAAWGALQSGDVGPMLVCCDIRMPGLSGLDLLQRVRQSATMADLPFVLISSINDLETIRKAVTMDVTGYIVKPFVPEDASARMIKVLNLARNKCMELPAQTLVRLKITSSRYSAYLSGMRAQIAQLFTEINAASQAEHFERITQKTEALQAGCLTLGLWRAANLLGAVRPSGADSTLLIDALSEINQHLQYQTYSVKV